MNNAANTVLSNANLQNLVSHVDVDLSQGVATVWHRWHDTMFLGSVQLQGSKTQILTYLRDMLPGGVIIKAR